MKNRGYFGLALYHPKKSSNWGSLIRTANLLECSFIAVIGSRYPIQSSDTLKSHRHLPIFEFDNFTEFKEWFIPYQCKLVGIEMNSRSKDLKDFTHPERAIYILGAEDYGLPDDVMDRCHHLVKLQGRYSMNVAVAGSIVLYHREGL